MHSAAVLSTKRHLAVLRWPQNALFPVESRQVFCWRQLEAYAAGHWPLELDEGEINIALCMVLRYGDV
jgi:hypothetical protein